MLKTLAMAAALAMLAAPVFAQSADNEAQGPARAREAKKEEVKDDRVKHWENILTELDRDKDGKISKEEMANREEAFISLDKNGDGYITRDEVIEPKRSAEEREKVHAEWKRKIEERREEKKKEDMRRIEKREHEGKRDHEGRKRDDKKDERKEEIRKEKDGK